MSMHFTAVFACVGWAGRRYRVDVVLKRVEYFLTIITHTVNNRAYNNILHPTNLLPTFKQFHEDKT